MRCDRLLTWRRPCGSRPPRRSRVGFLTVRARLLTSGKPRRVWAMLRDVPLAGFVAAQVRPSRVAACRRAQRAPPQHSTPMSPLAVSSSNDDATIDAAASVIGMLPWCGRANQSAQRVLTSSPPLRSASKLYLYHTQQDTLPWTELPASLLQVRLPLSHPLPPVRRSVVDAVPCWPRADRRRRHRRRQVRSRRSAVCDAHTRRIAPAVRRQRSTASGCCRLPTAPTATLGSPNWTRRARTRKNKKKHQKHHDCYSLAWFDCCRFGDLLRLDALSRRGCGVCRSVCRVCLSSIPRHSPARTPARRGLG